MNMIYFKKLVALEKKQEILSTFEKFFPSTFSNRLKKTWAVILDPIYRAFKSAVLMLILLSKL